MTESYACAPFMRICDEEMEWYRGLLSLPEGQVPSGQELMQIREFRLQVYFTTQRMAYGRLPSTH